MEDSILLSISKYLGLPPDYPIFDSDLIMLINSELSILAQLGTIPRSGFSISGTNETWSDLFSFGEETKSIPYGADSVQFVKEFIYLRVRLTFDPPSSSHVHKALEEKTKELMFRILAATDIPGNEEV